MSKRKKKSAFKKGLLLVFVLILISLLSFGGYFFYQFSSIKQKFINLNNVGIDFNSKDNVVNKYKDYSSEITNIALFGTDSRHEKVGDVSHSDSMMILSIDRKHNKIKLSSILRDSLVKIDGHGESKITHAYGWGGPELAIKTLNKNFNLNIEDYIAVDFSGLSDIIDSVGGVEINVKEKEIPQINKYGKEIAEMVHEKYTPVKNAGYQTLDGFQATAYARIRKVGNGDFERVERQKTVLIEIVNKIQKQGVMKYPKIISSLIPYTETSLSNTEILSIATDCITKGISTIDWYRFPLDGYCDSLTKNNEWYLKIQQPETTNQIHQYIYEDIKATPGTPKF